MKLAALFSGGKDSTYATLMAKKAGHTIECLVTVIPDADDSLLFHYPNSRIAEKLADAMQIPHVMLHSRGRTRDEEALALAGGLSKVGMLYGVEGIVHGGIASSFQKQAFEQACRKHDLKSLAPLWGADPEKYMQSLLDSNFSFMVVGVSAMGLDKEWLGRIIDRHSLAELASLSKKYGLNLAFEGGEAETLVVDCPLYNKRLQIIDAKKHWDGQRGIFEILEAELVHKDV